MTKTAAKFILQDVFWSVSKQFSQNPDKKNGANYRNRTDDLFITSELLYRLS